jgi:hypothetical protein
MIIGDFNLEGVAVPPNEAYPELIVYPDAMLSFAVALQLFQVISGEQSQITKLFCSMNLNEFSLDHLSKSPKSFRISTLKDELRILGSKRPDHEFILYDVLRIASR